ncbi:MAG TPA: aromatic amino acid lyase [Pseudonocardiaceae bacterium]|nr:aromatic amino acid lyase [Pseudonocardiaceae bacterium]
MEAGHELRIGAPDDLNADTIVRIAGGDAVRLDPELLRAVGENRRAMLEALTGGEAVVYGVSTGVGRFAEHRLDAQAQAEHQYRLLAGRAVGDPPWLPAVDLRAVMVIAVQACRLRLVDPAPALRWLRDEVARVVPLITADRPLGGEIGRLATALRHSDSGDR